MPSDSLIEALPKNRKRRLSPRQVLCALAEGATGIAGSKRHDLYTSLGRIFQRTVNGMALQGVVEQWEEYRDKGRIKDDYVETEQYEQCFSEILDSLDQDPPDAHRREMMKRVFLHAATETDSDRRSVIPQQLMRACRELRSGEILLLRTLYDLCDKEVCKQNSASAWLRQVVEVCPLKYESLVLREEANLIRHQLLHDRAYQDRSGIVNFTRWRLTDFGYELCRFMREDE